MLVSLGFSASLHAQDAPVSHKEEKELSFKSIHGHEVLPQKGDWALGISATGFLNYLGNMMNNTTFNNAPTIYSANEPNGFAIGQLSGVALMGKYMKSDDMAYRVRFQVNAGSVDSKNLVLKSSLTPDPLNPVFVEDKKTVSSYTALLSAGFEKRRGNSRLQGFYGAEVMVGLAGKNTTYTYGNSYDINFNAPLSTVDFTTGTSANLITRPKEISTGSMFLAGIRGFIGVEYFIAPKISLGGEIGYSVGMSTNGKGTEKTSTWDPGALIPRTITTHSYDNGGVSSWGVGLDNVNAGLNLHFYF